MEANDYEFRETTAEMAAIVLGRSADSLKLRVQYNPTRFNQVHCVHTIVKWNVEVDLNDNEIC